MKEKKFRSAFSVQSSLVRIRFMIGSKLQKEKYLFKKWRKIGVLVNRANHGSDPFLITTAELKDGYYILNGQKTWITILR